MMCSRALPDYYKDLGVPQDATPDNIRREYRKEILANHPDKFPDEIVKAYQTDKFQTLQVAYEVLSDRRRKAEYDSMMDLNDLRQERTKIRPQPSFNSRAANVKLNPRQWTILRSEQNRTAAPLDDARYQDIAKKAKLVESVVRDYFQAQYIYHLSILFFRLIICSDELSGMMARE